MGRLIRRYIRTTRVQFARTTAYTVTAGAMLKAGTSGTPLETATASVHAIDFYWKTTATSGFFYGLYAKITGAGIGGGIIGAWIQPYITATSTGVTWVYGVASQVELASGAYVASGIAAGFFKVKAPSDAHLTVGAYGLWVVNAVKCTPGEATYFTAIRISTESGTTDLDSNILTNARATHWIRFIGQIINGVPANATGTLSTASGYIKVNVDGNVRYIPLYTTVV